MTTLTSAISGERLQQDELPVTCPRTWTWSAYLQQTTPPTNDCSRQSSCQGRSVTHNERSMQGFCCSCSY